MARREAGEALPGMPGAVAAAAAPAPASPEERLAKLEDLRSKGALSEGEYQTKRADIIAEL